MSESCSGDGLQHAVYAVPPAADVDATLNASTACQGDPRMPRDAEALHGSAVAGNEIVTFAFRGGRTHRPPFSLTKALN